MEHFSTQVHLCEAEGLRVFLDEESAEEDNCESSLVAVKKLREDANKNAR